VSNFVLDASALLALLNTEEGADLVRDMLPDAVVSAVNLAEVVTRLTAIGMPEGEIRDALAWLGLQITPFDEIQGYQAGLFYPLGKLLGLSLGDRACLALAHATDATAVTADQAWEDLDIGVEIKLIR
jgi:ribonuclease VapC